MEITPKLAFAELRDVSRKWQSIGCHLDVGNLRIIRANYPRDEDCLDKMLREWLRNGKDPSWKRLCDALEAGGLKAEAEHIREKYCTQGTSGELVYTYVTTSTFAEYKYQDIDSVKD